MKTFYCYLILAQLNFIMDSVNILLPTFSRRTNCIFIIVVASASFAISLDGDFVFDDTEAIVNNKDIRLTTPILQVFENDFWGTNMLLNKSHKSYRPVTTLTFKLNLLLSDGELTPFKFKLTNLLLHVIASLLCSSVYEKLLDGSHQQTVFLSSLLFAIHPIHTEAVANVVGRADILCTIFGLIAFLFYCRTRHVESYLSNIFLTLISILFVGFSMFSKEQGITIFSICVLYDLILVFKIRIQDIAQYISFNFISKNCDSFQKSRKNEFLKTINMEFRFLCIRIMLLIASGMFLMYLRLRIMGSLPNFQVVDNPASFIENSALRTINYFYIYSLNAWLLLCPDWLCFDWSMGCVPLIESFSDFRLFVAVTFIFLLSGVCLTVLNLRSNELQRASLLSLIIILMTFLPASNLFFRVGFVVAERVLYLPSIGYCLLISIGVQKLASCVSSNTWHTILRACVCLLLIVFLARSVRRSAEWRTEKDLFRSGFRVCPLNAKVHYNMGKVADNRSMAMKHYREAIALNPNYYPALNNLANILKDIGELDEAEMYLRKAVQLKSDFAAAWMNLGIVLSSKKQFEESEQCFFTALKHRSHYPDCYYNLGNLYLAKKMFTGAYNAWQKAISQNPKHAVAWNNIIIMLDSLGKYGEGEEMANKALKLIEDDAGLHFNLANALGKLSRFEDSEESFLQAIRLKPDQPLYYVNLGVLYHRWKKFEKAKLMYYRALELNPNSESALRNLKMLQ